MNEVLRVIGGSAFFGATTAVALKAIDVPIGSGEFAGVLAADTALAAMVAIMLPLQRATEAFAVAGVAGAAGMFAFFAMTLAFWADAGMGVARDALLVLLLVTPVVAGVMSAGGAGYLAREVRRSRTRRAAMAHQRS